MVKSWGLVKPVHFSSFCWHAKTLPLRREFSATEFGWNEFGYEAVDRISGYAATPTQPPTRLDLSIRRRRSRGLTFLVNGVDVIV